MQEASCAQIGVGMTEAWFPTIGGVDHTAERVCAGCDVKAECLAFAVEHRESGIWGGVRFTEGRTA
jgi:WhiB family redox-sensing transcriptional regulator